MNNYHILKECVGIFDTPENYTVSINGETHLLTEEVHGDADGDLESVNFATKNVGILQEIAEFAESLGLGERWIIHPCYPAQVKERYPQYADHIIGDWPEITHHYHVFGNVLVVSNPMRLQLLKSEDGIGEFVRDNIGEPITDAQVQEYEKSRVITHEITQTITRLGKKTETDIGHVIFHHERPPFERSRWDETG